MPVMASGFSAPRWATVLESVSLSEGYYLAVTGAGSNKTSRLILLRSRPSCMVESSSCSEMGLLNEPDGRNFRPT